MKFVQELDRQVPLMDEIDTKVINFIKLKNVNADWNLVIYLSSKYFSCVYRWTKQHLTSRIRMLDLRTLLTR